MSPLDTWRWDDTTISYAYTDAFVEHFGPVLQRQVELAFGQWDNAFTSQQGTAWPHYAMDLGSEQIMDLRTLALHELGHVVGFYHPSDAVGRNYSYDRGGLNNIPPGPYSVMSYPIQLGRRNRILSNDELQGFQFAYGQYRKDFEFTNVTGLTSSPRVTIDYAPLTVATCPGVRPVAIPTQSACARYDASHNPPSGIPGRFVDSATVTFNANASTAIGFRSLQQRWHLKSQTGKKPTLFVRVRTEGTDNADPMDHVDNPGSHEFGVFETAGVAGPDNKHQLDHIWSMPSSGAIPNSVKIRIGITQDISTWCTIGAEIGHGNAQSGVVEKSHPVLLSVVGWRAVWTHEPVGGGGVASSDDCNTTPDFIIPTPMPPIVRARTDRSQGVLQQTEIRAHGVQISAGGDQRGTGVIRRLRIADVSGREPTLDEMTEGYFTETLVTNVLNIPWPDERPVTLSREVPLIVLLDGDSSSLPPAVQASGQYVVVQDHRHWAERPLLVQVDTLLDVPTADITATNELSTFALINASPEVARIPGPAPSRVVYLPVVHHRSPGP